MAEARHPSSTPGLFRDIYSVSRLNRLAKQFLEQGFPALIWVEGEVSNLSRPPSGHIYFSLKDGLAQVRCALFRAQLRQLDTPPQDGMHVIMRARVSLYEGRGEFQLLVEQLEDAGQGALRRALEALKKRLQQEGFFDLEHKKPLPRLPRRVGILTSPTGAVLHDIVTTLRRRFPAIDVLVYPIPVQGEGAARQIAGAIQLASMRRECDALILARGGGSLEDLWAFNEELVARAIFACELPIVCGVGHETDVTIADLVADVRAPTPTAAAELLSPDREEWLGHFAQRERQLLRLVRETLFRRQQQLDLASARLLHPRRRVALLQERLETAYRRLGFGLRTVLRQKAAAVLAASAHLAAASPRARLRELAVRSGHLHGRLQQALAHGFERRRERLRHAAQGLQTLSPLATLGRGYAIVQDPKTGRVVRQARELTPGDEVEARLAHGRLQCIVRQVEQDLAGGPELDGVVAAGGGEQGPVG